MISQKRFESFVNHKKNWYSIQLYTSFIHAMEAVLRDQGSSDAVHPVRAILMNPHVYIGTTYVCT